MLIFLDILVITSEHFILCGLFFQSRIYRCWELHLISMNHLFHFQDMLAVLTELHRALDMQVALESLVEKGNYCKVGQCIFFASGILWCYGLQFSTFLLCEKCGLFSCLLCQRIPLNCVFLPGIPSPIRVFTAIR